MVDDKKLLERMENYLSKDVVKIEPPITNSESVKNMLLSLVEPDLVKKVAEEYVDVFKSAGLTLDDLIAIGNTGLQHAAEKYNIVKHFSSYAELCVKQKIRSAGVEAMGPPLMPPHGVKVDLSKALREIRAAKAEIDKYNDAE